MSKKVRFSDIYKGSLNSEGSLTDLVNMEFDIINVEFVETNYGECAIVEIEYDNTRERRHTFSKVLIKQLKAIEDTIKSGTRVTAKLVRRKRYYSFQ